MKNIHLVPTYKPSSGYILGKCIKELSDVKIGQLIRTHYMMFSNEYFQPQNIYITSDEEIKEEDFYLYCNQVTKRFRKNTRAEYPYPNYQKIILTTDQDLIAGGVQAIDDEFLEWFVKNPSCEMVEVEKDEFYSKKAFIEGKDAITFKYEIIIPKEEPNPFELPKALPDDVFYQSLEEPKQDTVGKVFFESADKTITVYRQETLEEVAHKMLINYGIKSMGQSIGVLEVKKLMVNFAKWQQEQDKNKYSEEEVLDLLYKRDLYLLNRDEEIDLELPDKWFEQFKNK
jgi:hypothetical protein